MRIFCCFFLLAFPLLASGNWYHLIETAILPPDRILPLKALHDFRTEIHRHKKQLEIHLTQKPYPYTLFSHEPLDIHFIWVGQKLPKNYLYNLYQFQKHAFKYNYQIHLWTDRMYDDPIFSHIRLHHIREIMDLNFDFLSEKLQKYFRFLLYYESIGLKNSAQFSDWLRLVILYYFGGLYCDLDSLLTQKDKRRKDYPIPEGYLTPILGLPSETYLAFNNNLMFFSEKHPMVLYVLLTMMQTEITYEIGASHYHLQDKRLPPWKSMNSRRYQMTVALGPGSLREAFSTWMGNSHQLNSAFLNRIAWGNFLEQDGIKETFDVFGFYITHNYEQTWSESPLVQPKSFDDLELNKTRSPYDFNGN